MTGLLLAALPALAGTTVGTYGRVQATADLRGGQAEPINVVSYGSRLEKASYLEVDLMLDEVVDSGPGFKVVVTPALAGDLFHYQGTWDADIALRNLFVEAREFSEAPVTAWAGSRMYRGEDVHLLDFWPLDSLNTVGAGMAAHPDGWQVAVHGGVNRLANGAFQVQYDTVPTAGSVGTESVLRLDRQRLVGSLKGARVGERFKVMAYGEMHRLPEGSRLVDQRLEQRLPADRGSVLGLQATTWGWADSSFFSVWFRRATGLAAAGDLNVPGGVSLDRTVGDAREHLVAAAANHEAGAVGVQLGAYVRRYEDADANVAIDVDDRWEANVAVRPTVYPTQHTFVGVELSQQVLRPDGLNPRTDTHDVPAITKVAVLPGLQPRRGSFARPQLRLQYIYSYLNNDARGWFARDDLRHRSNHQHFLGIGAEWWLQSANYDR